MKREQGSLGTEDGAPRFRTERELQSALSKRNILSDDRFKVTAVRREFPMGGCVPVLVYVRFAERPPTHLWPDRWSFLHASIVWLLRQRRYLRARTLLTLAYDSPTRIEEVLYDLLDSGAVRELRSGAYALTDELASMRAEVVAVEAKMRDWKQALQQANAYQRFADRVSVVLDWTMAPRDKETIEVFRRSRTGLARLRPGSLDWIVVPASRSIPNGVEREYVITTAAIPSPYTLWAFR